MEVVLKGYLNNFYKSTSEGGLGLPQWIIDNCLITGVEQLSNNSIYESIQASSLSDGQKDLNKLQIKEMIEWMLGKDFGGKSIVLSKDDTVSYTQLDSFGSNNLSNVIGTDNGDGTRTIRLTTTYKPDGTQLRWGIAYPVTADTTIFDAIHYTAPYVTGLKGTTYTLLLSCLLNGEWKTKEVTVEFAE